MKLGGSGKKVNKKTYDISSIERVTRKFLEVSPYSRAKQLQRNVQKKCAACAKSLVRPTLEYAGAPNKKKSKEEHHGQPESKSAEK